MHRARTAWCTARTAWCTARTARASPSLSYVGRHGPSTVPTSGPFVGQRGGWRDPSTPHPVLSPGRTWRRRDLLARLRLALARSQGWPPLYRRAQRPVRCLCSGVPGGGGLPCRAKVPRGPAGFALHNGDQGYGPLKPPVPWPFLTSSTPDLAIIFGRRERRHGALATDTVMPSRCPGQTGSESRLSD